MEIMTTQENNIDIISITGNLDATTVSDFDDAWKASLDAGCTKLVVEMSQLSYISSAGLRGILMLAKTSKMKKASVVFAGMQSMVADMFKLSGFLSILSTASDKTTAISMLQ